MLPEYRPKFQENISECLLLEVVDPSQAPLTVNPKIIKSAMDGLVLAHHMACRAKCWHAGCKDWEDACLSDRSAASTLMFTARGTQLCVPLQLYDV